MKHKFAYGALIAGGAAAAVAFGPTVYATVETNRLPDNILSPLDELPAVKYQAGSITVPTLICPASAQANSCNTQNALSSLAIGNQAPPVKSLKDLQPGVAEAFVAAEDRRLYDDTTDGCDVKALIAAAQSTAQGEARGGSTLTRQTANIKYQIDKMTIEELRADPVVDQVYGTVRSLDAIKNFDSNIKSLFSKGTLVEESSLVKQVTAQAYECRVARTMTRDFGPTPKESKDNILLDYLNITDFGERGGRGIQNGAMGFYGIRAEQLTRIQAISLAAVLPSPRSMDVAVNYTAESKTIGQKYIVLAANNLSQPGQLIKPEQLTTRQILDYSITAQKNPEIPQAERDLLGKFINYLDESDRLVRNTDKIIDVQASLYNNPVVPDLAKLSPEEAIVYKDRKKMPISLVPFKPLDSANNKYDFASSIGARANVSYVLKQAALNLNRPVEDLSSMGLRINTTLDPARQKILYDTLRNNQYTKGTGMVATGADVAKDGAIRAMANSMTYEQTPLLLALGLEGGAGNHSSGSGLKGILLAEYLKRGGKLTDTFAVDATYTIPNGNGKGKDYVITNDECANLGRTAPCEMTAAEGEAVSSNTWAGQVLQKVGLEAFAGDVQKFGVTDKPPTNYASVLGVDTSPERLATAMAGLILNDGIPVDGYVINSITDPSGKVLWQRPPAKSEQVFPREVTKQTAVALNQVILSGTAKGSITAAYGPRSVAGKTGTEGIQPGVKGNATVNYTGVECGPDGGHATNVTIYTLAGRIGLAPEVTSNAAAKVTGKYIEAVRPAGTFACDLTQ